MFSWPADVGHTLEDHHPPHMKRCFNWRGEDGPQESKHDLSTQTLGVLPEGSMYIGKSSSLMELGHISSCLKSGSKRPESHGA